MQNVEENAETYVAEQRTNFQKSAHDYASKFQEAAREHEDRALNNNLGPVTR